MERASAGTMVRFSPVVSFVRSEQTLFEFRGEPQFPFVRRDGSLVWYSSPAVLSARGQPLWEGIYFFCLAEVRDHAGAMEEGRARNVCISKHCTALRCAALCRHDIPSHAHGMPVTRRDLNDSDTMTCHDLRSDVPVGHCMSTRLMPIRLRNAYPTCT
jgi:hypothetical protein